MQTLALIVVGLIAGGATFGMDGAAAGGLAGLFLSIWLDRRERASAAPAAAALAEERASALERELQALRSAHGLLAARVARLEAERASLAPSHAPEAAAAEAAAADISDAATVASQDAATADAPQPMAVTGPQPESVSGSLQLPEPASVGAPTGPSSSSPQPARGASPDAAFHVASRALDATGAPPAQPASPKSPESPASPESLATARPDPVAIVIDALREFFLGGNTVVRVGILVLLVGVVLLLKYAAEHSVFPLELRMAAAGALGLGLVLFGLRQRDARPGFARTLQGGGVAAMYLVVFFSYRTYALLPSGLAFGLLAAIALSSAVLAVMQEAMALVVIGQIGGFLAPILASSGSGNHVALFSYYLLLNLGIFGVAWFRAWRLLNLIGFVFTFGIGTAWGVTSYRADQFASTEPFLVAFFLLYVAIPVLFALRHEARGWVDGSLVFGAPLAFLGLQRALVDDTPFGMAYSTLALAALYIGLARYLAMRAADGLRSMREAFLALGVGFATLAVPYGLDNAGLTGATWAVEGAGLYWLGVRQARMRSRIAAVVLQGLAGIALLVHLAEHGAGEGPPVLNTVSFAALLLCLGSMFIARHAHKHRAVLPRLESRGLQALIGWGLIFLIPRALDEVLDHVARDHRAGAIVALLGVLGLLLELVARRLDWLPGRYPPVALIVLLLPAALWWDGALQDSPLSHAGLLGWPLYFAATLLTLRRLVPDAGATPDAEEEAEVPMPAGAETGAQPPVVNALHPLWLWGATGWLAIGAHRACLKQAALGDAWAQGAALASVALVIALVVQQSQQSPRARWPFEPHRALYMDAGVAVLAAALLLLTLALGAAARGQTAPLPYLPLLNPLDLAHLLGFAALLHWQRACVARAHRGAGPELMAVFPAILGAFAFLWWNAMLARSVHHMADVPFGWRRLWRSVDLQVAYSISWTVIGLAVTVLASRRSRRTLWMVGSGLLAVVVAKMFVIDLARLSTIAKIGTFLVVGLLLLAVGHLAPVPPLASPSPEPDPDPRPNPDDASEPPSADEHPDAREDRP